LKEGDVLLAIDGQRLSRDVSPGQLLVNQASVELQLTILPGADQANGGPEAAGEQKPEARTVLVRTVEDETQARYREWVENNRRRVHEETKDRVGYVHIPNMGPVGYAEFHRYYRAEAEREGLIVDVRFNGGGHVSQLLLEKLSRRRLGYDQPRYGQASPYPEHTVLGPMVALTNEFAGSDGDIFSHVFKLLKLGPLIGKRTWGGVVGIWPRHALVDGTLTTQPEFSFWFEDVGWGVENYGTDPDIEVDIAPQEYVAGKDTQLERGLLEILRMLGENPPRLPDFGARPALGLPKLPKVKKKK
jgi:tricorn protease